MKLNLTNILFLDAIPVLNIIERQGHEAYFVGGCVRDTMMNSPIHDIDIASSARPDEIQGLFYKTIDVGIDHGTVIVLYKNHSYEITTFRCEGDYSDHRRPDHVEFVRTLREDTLRRDFTINAMAINQYGEVFDYHGGQEDIAKKQIRAVGDPMERFNEDALRMVRALRFACQLGFKIENNTFQAILSLTDMIQYLSVERLKDEWTKILLGPYLPEHIEVLIESHIPQEFPGFHTFSLENTLKSYRDFLLRLGEYRDLSPVMAWAIFLYYTGLSQDQARRLLRQWTFSNKNVDVISQIIEHFDYLSEDKAIQPMSLYYLGQPSVEEMAAVHDVLYPNTETNLRQLKSQLAIQSKNDLIINGQDIMALLDLQKGGPLIGKILADLEYHIVTKQLPNTLEAVQTHIRNQNWE